MPKAKASSKASGPTLSKTTSAVKPTPTAALVSATAKLTPSAESMHTMSVNEFLRYRDQYGASALDGVWFIGCTTTHIYCRSTCTAHVKPENLTVFPSAAAAEVAGFRPCLRCFPEQAPHLPVVANDHVTAFASLIEEYLSTPLCVERALAALHASPADAANLGAGFMRTYGVTPQQYASTARRLLAKALLTQTGLSATETAHACGYDNEDALAHDFAEQYRIDISRWEKKCTDACTLALGYRTPYRFDLLANFLAFRAIQGVEVVANNRYGRTCSIEGDTGWIAIENESVKNRIHLCVSDKLVPHVARLVAKTRRLFDVDCMPNDVSIALASFHKQTSERFRVDGIRLPCSFDGFEMSVRAIIGQQITVKAANTLAGRLAQKFGEPCDVPIEGLDTVFPKTNMFTTSKSVEMLGELGIINRRAQAIRLLAEGLEDGSLDLGVARDANEALRTLVNLPGIGPWTANYMLMRAFHYSDGFPAADYGVKLGFPGLAPKEIERLSKAWQPYRSYAVMSLWCAPHE